MYINEWKTKNNKVYNIKEYIFTIKEYIFTIKEIKLSVIF
jgi:hypothetical protein